MKPIRQPNGDTAVFTDEGALVEVLTPITPEELPSVPHEDRRYLLSDIVDFERRMLSEFATLAGRKDWKKTCPDDDLSMLERFRMFRRHVFEYDNQRTLKNVN